MGFIDVTIRLFSMIVHCLLLEICFVVYFNETKYTRVLKLRAINWMQWGNSLDLNASLTVLNLCLNKDGYYDFCCEIASRELNPSSELTKTLFSIVTSVLFDSLNVSYFELYLRPLDGLLLKLVKFMKPWRNNYFQE